MNTETNQEQTKPEGESTPAWETFNREWNRRVEAVIRYALEHGATVPSADEKDSQITNQEPTEAEEQNFPCFIVPRHAWNQFYKELTSNLEPYDHYDTGYQDALDRVDDWLEILASKEAPTPATGSWEFVNDYQSRCTACGEISWIDHNAEHRFCPNCGTRMTLK